jgi:hypothetical protein
VLERTRDSAPPLEVASRRRRRRLPSRRARLALSACLLVALAVSSVAWFDRTTVPPLDTPATVAPPAAPALPLAPPEAVVVLPKTPTVDTLSNP